MKWGGSADYSWQSGTQDEEGQSRRNGISVRNGISGSRNGRQVGGDWQEEENEKIVWHPKFLFANAAAMC